jgi:hypothetical protein
MPAHIHGDPLHDVLRFFRRRNRAETVNDARGEVRVNPINGSDQLNQLTTLRLPWVLIAAHSDLRPRRRITRSLVGDPEGGDPSGIVVVEPDEPHEWRLVGVPGLDNVDQPLAMAGVDDLPFAGSSSADAVRGER